MRDAFATLVPTRFLWARRRCGTPVSWHVWRPCPKWRYVSWAVREPPLQGNRCANRLHARTGLLRRASPADNENVMEGGERFNRRSVRLKGYDYTRDGAYFVTVCTQGREHAFGVVVNGEMRPNECGR